MATATEVETKFELDAASFEHLMHVADVINCSDQLNVYYDRAWRLANHAATFRIRFSKGRLPVLTLKIPVEYSGEARVMKEFEYQLGGGGRRQVRSVAQHAEIDVDRQLPPEIGDVLLRLGVNRLERVGWVRNQRFVLRRADVGQFELDRLLLPDGQVFYEVEIESEDLEAHDRFAQWVRLEAPAARESRISKFQRFRAALGRQGRKSIALGTSKHHHDYSPGVASGSERNAQSLG
jgi:uncharacterized protein YjbK